VAVVLLLLGVLAVPGAVTADPTETLSVIAADGTLSLVAVNSSLDRVLMKIGEAIPARVVIETVLAGELARARVDASFTRVLVSAALRRLLRGRPYLVVYGPAGVAEIRVYARGTTGDRELAPMTTSDPPSMARADWPPDDAAEVTRLRQTVLNGPDAAARAEALGELSSIRDTSLLVETLAQVLARERDAKVLQHVLEMAAQQHDRIPPAVLRAFATRDLDGAPRAQAVELLADQADDPATRALLRSLATSDVSPAVREAAATALGNLEGPPARSASELPAVRTRAHIQPRNDRD